MKRSRISISSLCLAFLVAACSSESNSGSTQSSSGGGNSGSSSVSGGSSGGGSSSNPGGGSSSTPSGGSSVSSSGGSSKDPSGGSSAASAGASGGKSTSSGGAGTAGAVTSGGATGGGTGGTGGKATGGTTGKTGGTGAGGASSAGGGPAGGTGGASAPGGSTPPTTAASALVTSSNGAYWKTDTFAEGSGTANVTVNESEAQTWDGFGGAFNEMGWKYLNDSAMSAATREEALQMLFGKDGCNFAWGRIPIGASDYAIDRYTLNENAGDTTMSKFSIERDKDPKKGLIPYIQAAQKVKSDIRFWASPWTPPTWMKTTPCNPNSGKSNSMFDGCVMKNDDTTFKAFALYLVKWIQAYEELGIKIQTVAPQNEPNYEQNYPSCHWNTADYPKFIGSYLGPALESAGLATKVMDGTLSNATGGDADIGSAVLKDATAKKYCNAIGVQWGMADASRVSTLKGLAGGIPIWISETQCGGNMNTTSPAPNDFNYGKDTWGQITRAIKAGVTAYNAWNMVLDKVGMGNDDTRNWPQNALLVAEGGKITQTPAYYVFRHFSQFVDVGAKVLGTSGGDAVAFKNPDGSYVVVMFNSGAANSKYTVSVAGKSLQFSMPGNGWATVKYSK